MQALVLIKYFFLIFVSCFLIGENKLAIAEYIELPNDLKALRFKPDKINWSFRNSFLLLDTYNSELISINNSGKVTFSRGMGRRHNSYGELIWAGISPNGIQVVDRLENEIIFLDLNLNFIHSSTIGFNLYPEITQVDQWGRLFMYSNSYNGIFLFEKNYMQKEPFIDFSKEFYSNYCIKDFSISNDGEIAILGCDGILNEFSQNGMKRRSIPLGIVEPIFVISLVDDWLIFNSKNECLSIKSLEKLNLPKIISPILDITVLNTSIAILTKEQILVLKFR